MSRVQTANGYDQTYSVATNSPHPGVTFSLPPNEGDSLTVCVADNIVGQILGSGHCES
ncbi:MAG: hypothetical protein JO297_19475 [Nitrososphaeraceae archaeon]|nr:hypothetical protein [Nitrososphaeraceae archaeon]